MKTTTLIRTGLLVMAIAAFAISGCKKDKKNDNLDTSKMQQTVIDNRMISSIVDDAVKDADQVTSGGGSKGALWLPCNATLDSTFTIADTVVYIIAYNGLNCNGHLYREGTVEVHKNVNTHWHDAGATVYVHFINLKVTRVSTGKWAMVNGTKIHVNETGGFLHDLGNGTTSITRRVYGSLTATFEDNSVRTWRIARLKTFTGTEGDLTCTVDGFGSADGYNDLEAWGTNRHGDAFYNEVLQPVAFKESCSWDPVSGQGIIRIPAEDATATITFGYDDNNQPVTGGSCPTRCRVDWTKEGQSGTLYLPILINP